MQNKIHYAVSGETAAEVIYHRADAEKDFMGLMMFSGNQPRLREAKIVKNYLDEKEMRLMGQLACFLISLRGRTRSVYDNGGLGKAP